MQCWSLHALHQLVSSHQLEECPGNKGEARGSYFVYTEVVQTLAEILSEREMISHLMEKIIDEATRPWGVKVERVEIKVRFIVQILFHRNFVLRTKSSDFTNLKQ